MPNTPPLSSLPGLPPEFPATTARTLGDAAYGILDNLDAALLVWTADGSLHYANAAARLIFSPSRLSEAAHGEVETGTACYQLDGSPLDYDALPFVRVRRSGEAIANEVMRVIGPDNVERWLRVSCRPLPDGSIVGSATDITHLVELQQRLQEMAHHDLLTRLPNRALLPDRLRQALARSKRTRELVAICLADLDGFKPINDQHGHKVGDQVLREVAQRLLETVRSEDTVARIGGDEFVLILGGMKSWAECEVALHRIVAAVGQPYHIGNLCLRVSASVGVTLYPNDGSDQDILLRHADQAMYKAKEAGKNRFVLFDAGQELRARANQTMLSKIERGIAENQFRLYFQPKVDCQLGKVVGVEALVRWQHPVLGLLTPNEFLPLIEHDELMIVLGDWVLRTGLAHAAEWFLRGLDLTVSVNIAALQLHRRDFVDKLKSITAGYPGEVLKMLEIEIVETAALEEVNTVSDAIRDCRALGVSVALDDFGTGFSSLTHLKRLSANVLKIDQSFVRGMLDDPEDLAIVDGVIGLASAFKQQVVAEGVESIDHILLLLELGCKVMQGYGLARPMPADKLLNWLENFRPDPLWHLATSPRPNRDYFELLLADASHLSWIDQQLARARAPGDHGHPGGELDPARCRFGRWYASDGRRRFRNVAAFRQIDRVHREVHRLAREMHAAGNAGNIALMKTLETAMVAESGKLTALLREVRKSLAGELLGTGQPPAPPTNEG